MTYKIGKVAGMAHVSVRTLHYYDAIDLLNPSYETASGYRLYADVDLEVQDVVRRKHEHFNRNFYTCSVEMLAGLSKMWVSDVRFTATYEKIRPGLAQFWHDAVQVYCTNSTRK